MGFTDKIMILASIFRDFFDTNQLGRQHTCVMVPTAPLLTLVIGTQVVVVVVES